MKLPYSSTSPFTRKVLVCAIELGLADRIEKLQPIPGKAPRSAFCRGRLAQQPAQAGRLVRRV